MTDIDHPNFVPAPVVNPSPISGDIFPPTMGVEPSSHQPQHPTPTSPTPQKIVVGDKVFNTTEEAIAYADGFARSAAKTVAQITPNDPTPAANTTSAKRLGQLIFEDPDQALAEVENRAVERARSEQRVVDENKKFWEDFYLKHSDLRGSELLVDAVLAREQSIGTLRAMTRDEAAPILAAKARQEVSKIRNVPSGGQALPSNPAMVAGASGASTPKPPVPQPEPTNFVAELRNMRKRG